MGRRQKSKRWGRMAFQLLFVALVLLGLAGFVHAFNFDSQIHRKGLRNVELAKLNQAVLEEGSARFQKIKDENAKPSGGEKAAKEKQTATSAVRSEDTWRVDTRRSFLQKQASQGLSLALGLATAQALPSQAGGGGRGAAAAAAAPGPPLNLPNSAVRVLGEVEKSPNDDRLYRALELKNKLRVLLVSDPSATTAAAALDVHVGHFSDPADLPGLAHFCEHMLFLGTKKYPREDEFNSYLAQHGGSNNAYTDTQDTCYYFDVNADYLEGALDRFAQFFVAPLFAAAATQRELNAIESENAKNFQSDGFRLYQLEKSLANPAHPYSKFGTGSLDSLSRNPKKKGLDVRAALKEFHGTYYSAGAMTLAVVGKQSLDELQRVAERLFEPVPLLPYAAPPETAWDGVVPPVLPRAQTLAYNIVPIKEQRQLTLTWTLPYSGPAGPWAGRFGREERRDFRPEVFVGEVLGYEGPGSLLSYLKAKGWVNELGASEGTDTTGFQNFEISVDLTPLGQQNRYEVVKAIFSYLDLCKTKGIPQHVYEDLLKLATIGWTFQEKQKAESVAVATASNMQKWEPQKYISGQNYLDRYNDQLNQEFLKRLTPKDVRIFFISKDNAKVANMEEPLYKTKYGVENVDALVKEWETAPKIDAFALPKKNPFIPSDLSLKGPKAKNPEGPVVLQENDRWKVHFKQDLSFGQPKVYSVFQIQSTVPYSSPKAVAAFKMYQLYTLDNLNEVSYDAQLAGLNYEIEFNSKGVRLGFGGFNEKLSVLAKQVLEQLGSRKRPSAPELERYRDLVLRELRSFARQQPYYHAVYNSGLATEIPRWDITEIENAVADVTLEDIDEYVTKAFDNAFGEALIQGNMNKAEALALADAVQKAIPFKLLPREDRPERYIVELPAGPAAGPAVLARAEPNPEEPNSAVQALYQFPGRNLKDRACIELIGTILEQPFFDELRTKQQLGYIVSAGLKRVQGITSLSFLVQSNIADPLSVSEKILKFIDQSENILGKLSDQKFSEYRGGLIQKKLEPDKRLIAATVRNWEEIATEEYLYDRQQKEAEILARLSKEEVLGFFKKYLKSNSPERRLLISQVYGAKDAAILEKVQQQQQQGEIKPGKVVIGDLSSFKESRPVYPTRTEERQRNEKA